MTIVESGVIAGIPTGAIIGGALCKTHGLLGIVGGSFAGMASGSVAGWLYAYFLIFLLSTIGVLWRAARKRADRVPTEADMESMTPIAIRGIFYGALISLLCWFSFGWLYALVIALTFGVVTALFAVGRCELR